MSRRHDHRAWTPEDLQTLREMWGKHRSAEIALRLGRNTNSIIGKAHKINLPPVPAETVNEWRRAYWRERAA